jgi:hypothetical protein
MNSPAPLKTRLVAAILRHTPNCAEMARLASRALEQPLPWRTRLRMRLHYVICAWCERYARQLRFLHHAAPHLHEPADAPTTRDLSIDARRRIIQRLQDARCE